MNLSMKQKQTQQTWRTDLRLPRGGGVGEGWSGSLGLVDENCYIQNGLNSTGNYIHKGKVYEKECIYMYSNHFAVLQKLTQ